MINKELFVKYLNLYQDWSSGIEELSSTLFGNSCSTLFEAPIIDKVGMMLDVFLESFLTEEGQDLVYWWLFEDVEKVIYEKKESTLFSEETSIETSVETIDDLWSYMIKHKEDFFINE